MQLFSKQEARLLLVPLATQPPAASGFANKLHVFPADMSQFCIAGC
jgi:hypothetical protein